MSIYILALEVIIIMRMCISNPLGKTWPWRWLCPVESTDVTCRTHSGWLAAQLPWLVNLASLVCNMDSWLSCRVSALQSVVTGSISCGGDHSIHCWWDLIKSKQLSSISVCHVYVFAGFSDHGNSIPNIIPLLKKEKCTRLFTFHILLEKGMNPLIPSAMCK